MTWYKTGNVNVTNNSATVTGVGTAFVANVQPGEEFRLAGGQRGYEITAVVSDTQLTIDPPYMDSSQNGAAYRVVPVRGFPSRAYEALAEAIAQWDAHRDGPLAGLFEDGALGDSGMGFATAPGTGWFRDTSGNLVGQRNGSTKTRHLSGGLEVTGQLTGSAVQSGWLDATLGRLLKPGAFGWGHDAANGSAPEAPGTLLANLTVTGLYRFQSTHTDAPGVAGVLMHFNRIPSSVSGGRLQLAINNIGDMWVRHMIADNPVAYSPWNRIYNTTNMLGAVTQAGGMPAGALLESGSNANGTYERLASGLQICWRRFTTDGVGAYTWTFPAAFADTNYALQATHDTTTGGTGFRDVKTNNSSATAGSILTLDGSAGHVAADVSAVAIGRWF